MEHSEYNMSTLTSRTNKSETRTEQPYSHRPLVPIRMVRIMRMLCTSRWTAHTGTLSRVRGISRRVIGFRIKGNLGPKELLHHRTAQAFLLPIHTIGQAMGVRPRTRSRRSTLTQETAADCYESISPRRRRPSPGFFPFLPVPSLLGKLSFAARHSVVCLLLFCPGLLLCRW